MGGERSRQYIHDELSEWEGFDSSIRLRSESTLIDGKNIFISAILATILLGSAATPVFALSWAWGNSTATNFTTSTVVGLRAGIWPYWKNPPCPSCPWQGPDQTLGFFLTVFSPDSISRGTATHAWQIGLRARSNSVMMD